MNQFKIALSNTKNDLKDSDGRLLLLTQTVLIFFLLTLSLTSASVQSYLRKNLNNMLGADMAVSSFVSLTPEQETALTGLSARSSKTQVMTLTFSHEGKWQRAQLKLADDTYPLQGQLKTAANLSGTHSEQAHGPSEGELWLGPRLAQKLDLSIGDTITLGERQLQMTAILFHEPDRLMEGHSVAMRALAHKDSFESETIEGNDNRYRYLLEASPTARAQVEAWVSENLPGATTIKKEGGSHPLALFWKRTENFLGLASVLLFFMAAVAIDMANRRHLARQKHRLSLYLSFGVKMASGLKMAFIQWGGGFLASLILGGTLAYGAEAFLVGQLSGQFPGINWGWHVEAAAKTAVLAAALLLAFQVPALLQLADTSIISLIRAAESKSAPWVRIIWGFSSLALLATFYSDNALLTGLTLAAMGAALIFMVLLTWAVLNLGEFWARQRPGLLPFSFFMMKQRIFSKATQILGLGLCGLLLLFTLMLMRDIGASMDRYTRTNDGNLLISAAQPKHLETIEKWADDTGSKIRQLRPFTHAQLVQVNGVSLDEHVQKPSDTLSNVQTPIRMSWSDSVPSNNQMVDGAWWQADESDWHKISAEPEVITDLGFELGDTLTFQVDGMLHDFTLVASHAYKPGGGSITFWFQVPSFIVPAIDPPIRYMGSMELPDAAWDRLGVLWQRFPDLSLVPLKEITARFDDTLAFVTKLTIGFASMILLMAGVVIAASVKGFEADDRQKNGLLMSMGLRRQDCLKLSLLDWLITALIAGTGAVAGTWFAGHLIYQSQFSMVYQPDALWLIGSVLSLVIVVCGVGLAYCHHSLGASVKDLLAE